MTQTVPIGVAVEPPAAWHDPQLVDDVVLYDMARHQASVLSALLLDRQRSAAGEYHSEHWAARRRLVRQQVKSLDADDRAGLIAQHQAWSHETQVLTRRA